MTGPKQVTPVYLGVIVSLCQYCKHLDQAIPMRCTAYPDLIPLEIRWQNVDHRQPYLGDHGIRFELREDMEPYRYELFLREQVTQEDCSRYELKVEQLLGQEAEQVIEAARKSREANPPW